MRDEITVIPPKDGPLKLNFVIKEYMGWEIHAFPMNVELTPEQLYDDRYWPRDEQGVPLYHKPIKNKEDLKVGDMVICKGNPFDYIWNCGVVREIHGDSGTISLDEADKMIASMEFGKDDRECWVTGCIINTACLEKIQL